MIIVLLLLVLFLLFVFVAAPLAFFWKSGRARVIRWFAFAYPATFLLLLFGVIPFLLATLITHAGTRPPDRVLHETPRDYGLEFEEISFTTEDSLTLRGWWIPPQQMRPVVIGVHGLFRNRVELLSRIAPLCRWGCGALLFDSRSHGSSDRGVVSFGYHERLDVLGAMSYAEDRLGGHDGAPAILLMGVSMGAVAVLQAAAQSKGYAALILDSPYLDLRRTVADHTRLLLGLPPFPFADLFLFWLRRAAGFDPSLTDSRRALARVRPVPLLLIGSDGDRRIPSETARLLYQESGAPLKRLKIFGLDVPHGAAARLHPQEYAETVTRFLAEALPDIMPPSRSGAAIRGASEAAGSPK